MESRQGSVTSIDKLDSTVTHVVHPSPPEEHLDDEHTWYRVIAREPGKGVLVHWIYFPDSYDTWLQVREYNSDTFATVCITEETPVLSLRKCICSHTLLTLLRK